MDLMKGRRWLYIIGGGCGLLALSGYADWDAATWTLDIHPFNVKEFFLTAATTAGNFLAGLAAWRRWGAK